MGHAVALEAVASCSSTPLSVEDAGDHGVGIVHGQSAHERDRVLIRAHRGLALAWQGQVDLGECAAFPAQGEMGRGLVALDLDDHLLDQRANQLLPVARCGGDRRPDRREVRTERTDTAALLAREHARALILATCEFCLRRLERIEALLPCTLETTRDESVVGIDGAIAALGETCRIARPLDAEPPVLERGLAIHLQLLGSSQRRCDRRRLECCNEGACHSVVDLHATDGEAIAAAPLDEMLAGTVISGRRIATPVMCAQTAAAMPAAGEALQKCAALSHGGACLVRPWSRVACDALLVGLIGLPVDVTSMMLFDQHLPLIARQMLDSFAPRA